MLVSIVLDARSVLDHRCSNSDILDHQMLELARYPNFMKNHMLELARYPNFLMLAHPYLTEIEYSDDDAIEFYAENCILGCIFTFGGHKS